MSALRWIKGILVAVLVAVSVFGAMPGVAQADKPVEGDRVLIAGRLVKVYEQPNLKSKTVEELVTGMTSSMLKVLKDKGGLTWVYLSDNAYGWVQTNPEQGNLLLKFDRQQLDKIVDSTTKNITANPRDFNALLYRAMANCTRGDLQAAVEDMDAALTVSPQDGKLYDYRAKVHLDAGNFAAAVADATKAIELKRALPATQIRLAMALTKTGAPPEQVNQIFDEVAQAAPNYGLIQAYFGGTLIERGELDAAIDTLSKAIETDPFLAVAYNNRGLAYLAKGDPKTALADIDKAIELDPSNATFRVSRGLLYLKAKSPEETLPEDYEAAIQEFDAAIELNAHEAAAYANRATALLALKKEEEALADFQKAVELDPKNAYAWYTLGRLSAPKGELDAAQNAFTEAVNSYGRYAVLAHFDRAQVYIAKQQWSDAEADLAAFLAAAPADFDPKGLIVAHLMHGQTLIAQQKYEESLAAYQIAFAADKKFARGYEKARPAFLITPTKARDKELLNLEYQKNRKPGVAENYPALITAWMEYGRWAKAVGALKSYVYLTKDKAAQNFVNEFQKLIR